jgi:hypothetical protein
MNLKACQGLQFSRFASGPGVSGLAGMLISTMIVGLALIIITILASFSLLSKNLIK